MKQDQVGGVHKSITMYSLPAGSKSPKGFMVVLKRAIEHTERDARREVVVSLSQDSNGHFTNNIHTSGVIRILPCSVRIRVFGP